MGAATGANTNTNNQSTQTTISVDSTTAEIALPARAQIDPIQHATIYNSGNSILWLREYSASLDDVKHGTPIDPGEKWRIELPNMQTSEWSVIFESGGAKDVVIQYR